MGWIHGGGGVPILPSFPALYTLFSGEGGLLRVALGISPFFLSHLPVGKEGGKWGRGGEIYALTWVEATHGRYSVQTHSARLQTLPIHGTVSVIPPPSPLTWPHLCSVGARAYSLSFF